jgi:hypothetical protein
MATAQQRAWEREERRRLELAGQAEAERQNDELQGWIRVLDDVLAWSLDHPVRVNFPAMMVPLPEFRRGDLTWPLLPPKPEDFQPNR